MIVQVVHTLESGFGAGGHNRTCKNELEDTRTKWRTRGLGSIRWHEAQCQFDEEAQSQIDSGIVSLSHYHLL
jgi:hypothetical protein